MRLSSTGRLIASVALVWGCAATPDRAPCPTAKDPVCLYNRDFSCVNVPIDKTAPRVVHLGETYYFCNEECGEVFQSNPAKYLTVMK